MIKTILDPSGLRLFPKDRTAALVATVSSVVSVTLFVLLLDGLLFRRALPEGYEALFTTPLLPRMLFSATGSMLEEIQYRLLLTTALVVLASAIARRPLSPLAMVLIIGGVQLFNAWIPVSHYPVYGTLRYWLVGCVWGLLYWRHGFLAALAGHGAVHLLLDPALREMLLLTQ
ncbi:hypothetical protein WBP06_24695 [Novosphingobium sp. BL-8H]|uniref:hypothetical protein n=1 Tax=Novosphingobium sp. BL-8H TaxID=3127640 RepID=UPI0037567EC5